MTKKNHLNGPWEAVGDYIIPKGTHGDALFYILEHDDAVVNLAAAAPDLLEVLEAMLEFHHGPVGQRSFDYNAAVIAANAIAKAKGES